MTATLASTDPIIDAFAIEVGTGAPVAIEGRRTRWALGGAPDPGTRLVWAPTGIVDHQPYEMTVRVRAGTTVAELHAVLAEHGQRTALPDRGGTVGGALAVGENDIRALGLGLVRTAPLQVRYVSAEGRVITSGGPTVKNVSGFDLPRLLVGSLGTLGLLAEVVLRTNPIPAASTWLELGDTPPGRVLDTVVAPSAVLYDGQTSHVLLEGHGPDVEAETRALAGIGDPRPVDGPPPLPPHRWSLPPAELARLHDAAPDRDLGRVVTVAGLGLAFADEPQPIRPLAAPVAEVAARLKANFDPTGRLNPGRDPGRK